jgi:hypothetical protein
LEVWLHSESPELICSAYLSALSLSSERNRSALTIELVPTDAVRRGVRQPFIDPIGCGHDPNAVEDEVCRYVGRPGGHTVPVSVVEPASRCDLAVQHPSTKLTSSHIEPLADWPWKSTDQLVLGAPAPQSTDFRGNEIAVERQPAHGFRSRQPGVVPRPSRHCASSSAHDIGRELRRYGASTVGQWAHPRRSRVLRSFNCLPGALYHIADTAAVVEIASEP